MNRWRKQKTSFEKKEKAEGFIMRLDYNNNIIIMQHLGSNVVRLKEIE